MNTILNRTGAAHNLGFLCAEYVCHILNHIASPALGNIPPLQALTGQTVDISALLCYTFNQKVIYVTPDVESSNRKLERTGRWVGFARNVGDALTWKILPDESSIVIYRSNIRPVDTGLVPSLRGEEVESPTKPPPILIKGRLDTQEDPSEITIPMPSFDPQDLIGRMFYTTPKEDGSRQEAQVKRIIQQIEDDQEFGRLLKIKAIIEVDHGDHKIEEIITYNKLLDYIEESQMEEQILDLEKKVLGILSHQGPYQFQQEEYLGSTYNVKVNWNNGDVTTEPLCVIADQYPVLCAGYGKKHNLLNQKGWKHLKRYVSTNKETTRMMFKAILRQGRKPPKVKFGHVIPRDYNEAMTMDKVNNNSLWQDAVAKEIEQLDEYSTFNDLGTATWDNKGKVTNAPAHHKKIRVHLVFDVKHDGRHKARLVADGHLTDDPDEDTYSGVVSLRSLRLTIFLAELNNLELWGADIGNAYLEAITEEKVFVVAGPEFGERQGKVLVIHKALYGLKSSGKRFWEKLHDELVGLGFFPSKADPQIWMRPTSTGDAYEYIAVYVDDLAIAALNCLDVCNTLKNKCGFKLKGEGPLTYHLGCDFIRDPDGTLVACPKKCIKKILEWYEYKYKSKPKKTKNPLEPNDHPELDTSAIVMDCVKDVQSMVGQLQWLIALARFDIMSSVVTMSRFRTCPREGHVDRCKKIYGYIADMDHGGIRFRTEEPEFSNLPKQEFSWARSVYANVKEKIPEDCPPPRGRHVVTSTYVDANLHHDHVNGRALTGILHFVNATPIDWYSKRQATVETATYGSEYVAARIAVDQIIDLRNTLRYLGVPIREKSYLFGDNKSVVDSSTLPQSPLKKRHHALSYHRVREAIAAEFIGFYWIEGSKNPADVLSKHWKFHDVWPTLKPLMFWRGDTSDIKGTESKEVSVKTANNFIRKAVKFKNQNSL